MFDVDGTLAHRGPDGRAHAQPGAVDVLERIRARASQARAVHQRQPRASETMAAGLREDGMPVRGRGDADRRSTARSRYYPPAAPRTARRCCSRHDAIRDRHGGGRHPGGRPQDDAEVVFVAHVEDVDLRDIERAARAVARGAPLLTGSYVRGYAGANGMIFSRGAMVTARDRQGRRAPDRRIVGKPSRAAVERGRRAARVCRPTSSR